MRRLPHGRRPRAARVGAALEEGAARQGARGGRPVRGASASSSTSPARVPVPDAALCPFPTLRWCPVPHLQLGSPIPGRCPVPVPGPRMVPSPPPLSRPTPRQAGVLSPFPNSSPRPQTVLCTPSPALRGCPIPGRCPVTPSLQTVTVSPFPTLSWCPVSHPQSSSCTIFGLLYPSPHRKKASLCRPCPHTSPPSTSLPCLRV